MTIYTAAPPARTFSDDKPTLLVCWWCTTFAATIILFRICGRYIRTEKLFREDWLALVCLFPLCVRMGFVHVVLLYGTNNVLEPARGWSDEELYRRRIGSQLVLASRVFYAATLWMLKLTITEFFKRLIIHIWKRSYEITLRIIRWTLLITFLAVIISDLAECQPVTHYWQVSPDPGPQCRQGFAQLLTMGICNVVTDLLLVLFPIPIILLSQMGKKRKLQLVLLFGLSIIPVIVTVCRMKAIIDRKGQQQYRSVWASIEILAATGVANALVLGSFVRDRGVKKIKWKFGSTSDSMERTVSRRGTAIRHWGSDEDLVRDIGLGVDPKLRTSDQRAPRIAPMATAANVHVSPTASHLDPNWSFPQDDSDTKSSHEMNLSPRNSQIPSTPSRQVSFFDVSNLLGDAASNHEPSQYRRHTPSIISDNGSLAYAPSQNSSNMSPTTSRKGSHNMLQDVGSLLKASPRNPRSSQRNGAGSPAWGIELESIPQNRAVERHPTVASLQDVGGLLNDH